MDVPTMLDCHPSVSPLLRDPQHVLWVTEGVKKGDSLAAQGAAAVALPGVWNFKNRQNKAQWDHIELKGRQVNIVYDSDVSSKPGVRKAQARLAEFLRVQGARPFVCVLPHLSGNGQKTGVDDYLVAGHTLQDLVWSTREWLLKPALGRQR